MDAVTLTELRVIRVMGKEKQNHIDVLQQNAPNSAKTMYM